MKYKLHLEEYPRDAPKVVLLQGLGGTYRYWNRGLDDLTGRFHVITVDLLGFGDSDKPWINYTRERHLDAMEACLQRYDQFFVVGHSLGAALALVNSARNPQQVIGQVLISLPYYPTEEQAYRWLRRTPSGWLMPNMFTAIAACLFTRGIMGRFLPRLLQKYPREIVEDLLKHNFLSSTTTLWQVLYNSSIPQDTTRGTHFRTRALAYEDTAGVAVGDFVEKSGELLSVELGSGLLRRVYDGLQNPLHRLEIMNGKFLQRGAVAPALDRTEKWSFDALARVGDKLRPGDTLGTVQEGRCSHKIMVPFLFSGEFTVDWIQGGTFGVDTVITRLNDGAGRLQDVRMVQRWPVRKPLSQALIRDRSSERVYPTQPLVTTLRLIDTFFPIAKGGTACIPGPFGAGKTVLQNLISRYSDVDIVIVVACGERAGEVVETITDFPQLQDPRTGESLMDRTIIICNTSSMPVAARGYLRERLTLEITSEQNAW